jgi:hypothetical protein
MENLNNLPPFFVGQKVVYITGNHMPKDSIHTVLGCKQYPCGHWTVKINTSSGINYYAKGLTCICLKSRIDIDDGIEYYWAAASFRPLQEQKFPLIKLKKIIEKELVSAN